MLKKSTFVLIAIGATNLLSMAHAADDAKWASDCQTAQDAYDQAHYADAERLFATALEHAKEFGDTDKRVGMTLGSMASVYMAEGKYKQAEEFFKKSLQIKEASLPANDASLATTYNNLAALYRKEGKTSEAINLLEKALVTMEKTKSKDSPEVLMIRSNLAQMRNEGRGNSFLELEKTLAKREESFGPDSVEYAQSLNNMAEWYRLHKEFDKAEPLYKRSLAITEKLYGPEHPDSCTILANLGILYLQKKEFTAAEPYIKKALAGREKVLGPNHPDTAISLQDYASFYRATNKIDLANEYEAKAKAIKQQQ